MIVDKIHFEEQISQLLQQRTGQPVTSIQPFNVSFVVLPNTVGETKFLLESDSVFFGSMDIQRLNGTFAGSKNIDITELDATGLDSIYQYLLDKYMNPLFLEDKFLKKIEFSADVTTMDKAGAVVNMSGYILKY